MLQACVAGFLRLHERAQPKNHLNEHIETESQPARTEADRQTFTKKVKKFVDVGQ